LPLQPGTRIGGYEIVALLGAGGMGEVYRARDQRLGRDVAIKILSPRIAADAGARARFDREARALAALNHPNIAAIFGVEDHGSQPALVLELVEGPTLADRLARHGPLPAADAIEYAKQIADALDVAHEAGIVHRDLKPGNIAVTDAGRVKILDFGLAKAIAAAAGESPDNDPADSPTITVPETSRGVILGTAAYMSPEQARGKRIDKRTDIWAFGCVLFEMLTGRRPFNGETTQDVIAAILERPPDLSPLPAATPAHIRRTIERCLEKEPKRRARDIADVRAELDVPAAPLASATPQRWRVSMAVPAVMALVTLIAIAVAVTAWRARSTVAPPAPIEFTYGAPPGYALVFARSTVSPDGRFVAFVARDDQQASVFVRSLEASTSRRLEGTEGAIGTTHWSPDSRSIAFLTGNTWKRISIDGGPAVTIVSNILANIGASWGPGDTFLVATTNRTSLARVPVSGGPLEPVTTLDAQKENSHRWPQWLPDGRHFLFTVRSDRPESLGIKVGSLETSDTRTLVNVASQGVYVEPGWLLYVTPDLALMAQRVTPGTWTLQGTAVPIAGGVRYNGPSFLGAFDASLDGRVLTYVPAPRQGLTLEWFDRTGRSLGRMGPEQAYRSIRLSPDGKNAAVELADVQLGTRDLWLVDGATNAVTRLTSNPATDWRPVFSPDGSTLAFASDRAGASTVFRVSSASAGNDTILYRNPDGGAFPVDWSRDGKQLLVTLDDSKGRNQGLALVPAGGGPSVRLADASAADVPQSRISPSGDRVALMVRAAGSSEVYLMALSDRRRVRVSTDGGLSPAWGPDGRELFFLSPRNEIMRAGIDGMTVTSRPQALFQPCASIERTFSSGVEEVSYDVSPDGTRFLAICSPPDAAPAAITTVVNWQAKLK
jgi:Tol biopolymer transport system component